MKKEKIMKFQEYDIVRVITDRNTQVKKGAIGTIIMTFLEPQEAYEVEFLDERGRSEVQLTLVPGEIEKIG